MANVNSKINAPSLRYNLRSNAHRLELLFTLLEF